jgi:hypothetical protein
MDKNSFDFEFAARVRACLDVLLPLLKTVENQEQTDLVQKSISGLLEKVPYKSLPASTLEMNKVIAERANDIHSDIFRNIDWKGGDC